jgi:hypothetical protein
VEQGLPDRQRGVTNLGVRDEDERREADRGTGKTWQAIRKAGEFRLERCPCQTALKQAHGRTVPPGLSKCEKNRIWKPSPRRVVHGPTSLSGILRSRPGSALTAPSSPRARPEEPLAGPMADNEAIRFYDAGRSLLDGHAQGRPERGQDIFAYLIRAGYVRLAGKDFVTAPSASSGTPARSHAMIQRVKQVYDPNLKKVRRGRQGRRRA